MIRVTGARPGPPEEETGKVSAEVRLNITREVHETRRGHAEKRIPSRTPSTDKGSEARRAERL